MPAKYIPLLIFIFHSMAAQTISWNDTNGDSLDQIKIINITPTSKIFVVSANQIYSLDSNRMWTVSSAGISQSYLLYGIAGIGYSPTTRFVAIPIGNGLFRSLDDGKSWQLSNTGVVNSYIKKFLAKGDTIFAMPPTAFYLSVNNGDSWAYSYEGIIRPSSNRDVVLLNDGSLLLATSRGLFRTTNNTVLWNEIIQFSGRYCYALAVAPSGELFAAVDTSLFRSTNNGVSWSELPVHNKEVTKMFYADSSLFLLNGFGESDNLYRLRLGPDTAIFQDLDINSAVDMDIAPNGVLHIINNVGTLYTYDTSVSQFAEVPTGFRHDRISAANSEFGITYIGIQERGIFKTTDKGVTWNALLTQSHNPKAIYLSRPHIFIGDSTTLYRSSNSGTTWNSTNPVPGKGASAIVKSGTNFFAVVEGSGIYCSTDGGSTWEQRTNGIGSNVVPSLVSLQADVLMAATMNGLYKTTNAGLHWTNIEPINNTTVLYRMLNGFLYVGTADGGYRSTDGGTSWVKMNGLEGSVTAYASILNSLLLASTSNGLYSSSDGGVQWQSSNATPLHNIVADGNTLFGFPQLGMLSTDIAVANPAINLRWLSVGSLHNWFSSFGSEREEGAVAAQQYGWQYPALRPYQDMQVSKGFWIGTTNYADPANGIVYPAKVVHHGPRANGTNEIIPQSLLLSSKFDPPVVTVNDEPTVDKNVEIDEVNPAQSADRIIQNEIVTSIGISMKRVIRQFSQQYHDNYNIAEYTFVNTNSVPLNGVYFYYLYRWGINAETRYVIGGNPTGWGINTMLDSRGDGLNPATTFFPGNKDNDVRAVYGWHGKYPPFTNYDNIGGPIFVPYYDKSDTVGRLGAPQFVGVATIHADKSASDTTNDSLQPSTINYVGSDESFMIYNSQYDSTKMNAEYNLMSAGRAIERHADKVGPNGDPAIGTSGGWSATLGFGPYSLSPGDSIRIVLVEAAACIDEETALNTGMQFKLGAITAAQKNQIVYTGRASLFQTFRRAMANYASGYAIPQPPLPPKTFTVTKEEDNSIRLEWTVYAENDPRLSGFEIYRTKGDYFRTYTKIYECNNTIRSFIDSNANTDEKYFYYIVSVGNKADNDGNGLTPSGRLKSNRYYTQTYDPIYGTLSAVEKSFEPRRFYLNQNYPNPFNPSTSIQYEIPGDGIVTLKIHDVLGREVQSIINEFKKSGRYVEMINARSLSSGIYFYTLQFREYKETKKMLLLR